MLSHLRVMHVDENGLSVPGLHPHAYLHGSMVQCTKNLAKSAHGLLSFDRAERREACIYMLSDHAAKKNKVMMVAMIACPNPDCIDGIYYCSFAALGANNRIVVGDITAGTLLQTKRQLKCRVDTIRLKNTKTAC